MLLFLHTAFENEDVRQFEHLGTQIDVPDTRTDPQQRKKIFVFIIDVNKNRLIRGRFICRV